MADEPASSDEKFKIDFIDPLFAVAIHIGFVEGLPVQWSRENARTGITNVLTHAAAPKDD